MKAIGTSAKGIAILIAVTAGAFVLGVVPAKADCFCYDDAGGRTCECW